MIGIVMAGGKGSRMNTPNEKLLFIYKKPIILHVIDALKDSNMFSQILAITSPNSPKTRDLLQKSNIKIIETRGKGYVEDLNHVLSIINDIVFVTSADLPLLDDEIIKNIIAKCDTKNTWTSILVTKQFLDSLNLSSDFTVMHDGQTCCYTGVSIVNANLISDYQHVEESFIIVDDKRIAFNLNTPRDYELFGAS